MMLGTIYPKQPPLRFGFGLGSGPVESARACLPRKGAGTLQKGLGFRGLELRL